MEGHGLLKPFDAEGKVACFAAMNLSEAVHLQRLLISISVISRYYRWGWLPQSSLALTHCLGLDCFVWTWL